MTEPSSPPPPSSRLKALVLAAVLSVAMIGAWGLYLVLTPPPMTTARPAVTPPPTTAQPVLRLLMPRGALSDELIRAFESNSGLKLRIDAYDRDEEVIALAAHGELADDAVIVSGVVLSRLVATDRLAPLQSGSVSGADQIDPASLAIAAQYDAGNRHALPLDWSAMGLLYDKAKLAEHLETSDPPDSWQILFDPAIAAKLAACGIQASDVANDDLAIALATAGLPQQTRKVDDYEAAAKLWETTRPNISKFSDADASEGVASGRVCLAAVHSGAAVRARAQARAAGHGDNIGFVIPKEGSVARYEAMAMPTSAANAEGALRLFGFLLRPDVAARLVETRGHVSALAPVAAALPEDFRTDPALNLAQGDRRPPPEFDAGADLAGLWERFWQLINAPGTPPAESH